MKHKNTKSNFNIDATPEFMTTVCETNNVPINEEHFVACIADDIKRLIKMSTGKDTKLTMTGENRGKFEFKIEYEK